MMASEAQAEAAAGVIFCHAQFKGDDYTAKQLAHAALEAADESLLL